VEVKPYGSWRSPITSDLIVAATIGLGQIVVDGSDIYWTESRPQEQGRNAIARLTKDGQLSDNVTPTPFNVRTRVHEYGGGDFTVHNGTIYFANYADQRLYRSSGNSFYPLTPEGKRRYADLKVDGDRLICVCEDHTKTDREATNSIVAITLTKELEQVAEPKILITGHDFYASPCLSPDGTQLAWLTWNHPNMPWDGTELWVGKFGADGSLSETKCIAGGIDQSIFQPQWSPDGVLHFVSDSTNWWNLYRWHNDKIEPLCPMAAEFGRPQWVFGMSTYGFESRDRIVCTYTTDGIWYLATLNTTTKQLDQIDIPYTEIGSLYTLPGSVVFVASSPTEPNAIARLDLDTHKVEVLRRSSEVKIEPGYFSRPQAIAFPTEPSDTEHSRIAYGFFYPPQNRDYAAPDGDRPPLIVKSHGGPTASTSSSFSLSTQYWTSRGFAILDVNYGGSTGYGRDYRQRLQGQWGITDVDDCVNGAQYLVDQGLVDRDRLTIKGGSAGGYTTLAALTFRNVFKAGASYYGVSDLEVLAQDTHKFESRYLDGLIGAYPDQRDLYVERSPIHFVDKLACPVIFFQGLEDRIVPPNQAEMMVEAIAAKGLPVAYVPFEGEQHGFRRSENIKRTLDAELYFYAKVFNFAIADPVEPVIIRNLD
jgi:dipeptidyl aminopeptidase/acylaminoacyl peptidase